MTLIKKCFGIAPQEFLLRTRLNRSLKLLNETDFSVEQIAYRCGFNSCSYFIKQFKSEFSTTPIQYKYHRGTEH